MNNAKIKKLAKELCHKSGCHHKCHDTKDCVVEDEAREYLHFVLTNEEKVSVKDKQIEEMARIICKSTSNEGNCDKCGFNKQCSKFKDATNLYNAGYRKQSKNTIELPCKVGDMAYVIYRGAITQGTVRLIRPFVSEQETIFKGKLICEVDNLFIDDGTKEKVELYVVFEKSYGIERIAYLNREEAEQALAKMKGGEE